MSILPLQQDLFYVNFMLILDKGGLVNSRLFLWQVIQDGQI